MIKKIVIFGALALAGVGAYIYFKPKSKVIGTDTIGAGTTDAGTTGTGTSGTGTAGTSTTPAPTDTILNTAPIVNPDVATYTNVLSNNPTAQELEAKAKAIAKGKDLASKICQQKKIKDSLFKMDNTVFCKTYGCSGVSSYDTREIDSLKNSRISYAVKQIESLNKELGLLGYMEVDCDILRINI